MSQGLGVWGGYLLSHFRSTIGAAGFNFSVRNGKRWSPRAMAYTPESIPDGETGATLQWLPAVDLTQSVELPLPANISSSEIAVAVEGLTPQGSVISN